MTNNSYTSFYHYLEKCNDFQKGKKKRVFSEGLKKKPILTRSSSSSKQKNFTDSDGIIRRQKKEYHSIRGQKGCSQRLQSWITKSRENSILLPFQIEKIIKSEDFHKNQDQKKKNKIGKFQKKFASQLQSVTNFLSQSKLENFESNDDIFQSLIQEEKKKRCIPRSIARTPASGLIQSLHETEWSVTCQRRKIRDSMSREFQRFERFKRTKWKLDSPVIKCLSQIFKVKLFVCSEDYLSDFENTLVDESYSSTNNPVFEAFFQIDNKKRGKKKYLLWEIEQLPESDGDGNGNGDGNGVVWQCKESFSLSPFFNLVKKWIEYTEQMLMLTKTKTKTKIIPEFEMNEIKKKQKQKPKQKQKQKQKKETNVFPKSFTSDGITLIEIRFDAFTIDYVYKHIKSMFQYQNSLHSRFISSESTTSSSSSSGSSDLNSNSNSNLNSNSNQLHICFECKRKQNISSLFEIQFLSSLTLFPVDENITIKENSLVSELCVVPPPSSSFSSSSSSSSISLPLPSPSPSPSPSPLPLPLPLSLPTCSVATPQLSILVDPMYETQETQENIAMTEKIQIEVLKIMDHIQISNV